MSLSKKPLSILLVDDDEDYYYLAKEAFEEAGITDGFSWVSGGQELFESLKMKRPGLILLDLNMPRMDGFQVLEKIKVIGAYKCIPIVILTTSRAESDVTKSFELGASGFISKPIDFTQLVDLAKSFVKYWHEVSAVPE